MPRRAAAPAHPRGFLRSSFAGLFACALLAFAVAGCGGDAATLAPAPTEAPAASQARTPAAKTPKPTKAPATPPQTSKPSAEPTDVAEPTEGPTEEPTAEPTEEPTAEPTEEPTAEPSPSPSSSAAPGATACTGTADNQDFYASLASSVTWDVYCAVLPAGWRVETGSYRLRNGGQLTISYKGPGGARLELKEGAFCAGQSDCPPGGGDPGSASFGNREARLTDLGGAHFAVIAEDGDLAWQASATGIDADILTGLAAAFVIVGD